MNHLYLSPTELEQFQKIHYETIYKKKRTKLFQMTEFWESTSKLAHKNKSIYPKIDPILKKTIRVLDSLGIKNYDKNYFSMDFHQRNCGFEKKKYQWSTWHKDDYAATNYKVHTVLFYLRKDVGVIGGDLDYKINNVKYTHLVKPGDILSFKGDLQHKPQGTSGFGCRDIVVVLIKRTNK
jgi:hypothetical protein